MSLNPPSHKYSPPLSALFFSLFALAWCGFVAFPTAANEPCFTSGCAITKNISIAGISLWWIGGGYFFLLSIICLRGMRYFAWRLSQFALFLDSLFLVAMFITGPCIDCLVIAFFFAITSYLLRPTPDTWFYDKPLAPKLILLPIWFGLFLGNCLLVANEVTPSLTMNRDGNPSLRIYFSPTCPACREAIAAFGDQAQLYPVLESENDLAIVMRMQAFMEQGSSAKNALTAAMAPSAVSEDIPLYKKAFVMVGLLRNKAAVFKQGFGNMPLIEVNGMPKAWTQNNDAFGRISFPHGVSPREVLKGEGEKDKVVSFDKAPLKEPFFETTKESVPPPSSSPEGSSLEFLNIGELKQCGKDAPCPE